MDSVVLNAFCLPFSVWKLEDKVNTPVHSSYGEILASLLDEDFAKNTSKAMYFISPFLFILSLCFPLMQCVQIYPLSGKSSWCPVIPIQRLHFHEGPYQTPTAHIFSVTSLLPQLLCDAVLLGTGLQKKTLIFPAGFLSCLSAGGGRGSSK